MTEERKQELRQLLNEAMENLEIRQRSANNSPLPPIDIRGYGVHLRQYWKSYAETSLGVVMTYEPNIANEDVKSKILDFIRVEFASFIDEDKILSASFFSNRRFCRWISSGLLTKSTSKNNHCLRNREGGINF